MENRRLSLLRIDETGLDWLFLGMAYWQLVDTDAANRWRKSQK
jgi:hypothetical protein